MCVNDPYSNLPALIKIAFFIDIYESQFAFLIVIRRLSLGRLFYILVATPTPGMMEPILAIVAPIFDLVKFETLDASINTMPFPVKLYSGTKIPGGIYFLIKKFNFFGFVKARRIMVNMNPAVGKIDIQIYVDPMKIEVGGITLLEIRGPTQADKFTAQQAIQEKVAQRAREAQEGKKKH